MWEVTWHDRSILGSDLVEHMILSNDISWQATGTEQTSKLWTRAIWGVEMSIHLVFEQLGARLEFSE